jgi:hypothetical protein
MTLVLASFGVTFLTTVVFVTRRSSVGTVLNTATPRCYCHDKSFHPSCRIPGNVGVDLQPLPVLGGVYFNASPDIQRTCIQCPASSGPLLVNPRLLVEDIQARTGGRVTSLMTSDDSPAFAAAIQDVYGEAIQRPRRGRSWSPSRCKRRGRATGWWLEVRLPLGCVGPLDRGVSDRRAQTPARLPDAKLAFLKSDRIFRAQATSTPRGCGGPLEGSG